MTTVRMDGTSRFDATGTATDAPTAEWAAALNRFFDAGNTLTIDGRHIGAEEMHYILGPATQAEREARFREVMGNPRADYDDFKRFADDVMRTNPGATGQDFALSGREARRVGVIDRSSGRDTHYPDGTVRVERTDSAETLSSSMRASHGGHATGGVRGMLAESPGCDSGLLALFDRASRSGPDSAAVRFRDLMASPELAAMSAEERGAVLRAISAFSGREPELRAAIDAVRAQPRNAELLRTLTALGADATFASHPDSAGADAIRSIAAQRGPNADKIRDELFNLATDPACGDYALERIALLAASPEFARLSDDDRLQLMRVICGRTDQYSVPQRDWLIQSIDGDRFFDASPAERATLLREFLAEEPRLDAGVMAGPSGAMAAHRRSVGYSGPEPLASFEFEGARSEPASRYMVTVGDRTVPVIFPEPRVSSEGPLPSIDEISASLSALPPESFALVTEVRINPHTNSADERWRREYHWDADDRSFMTCGAAGVIDIYPQVSAPSQDDYDSAMVHETGHALSNRAWGSLAPGAAPAEGSGWARWDEAMRDDENTVSGYARSDRAEDFAETYNFYMQVRGTERETEARRLFPRRFALIDELVSGAAS